MDRNFKPLKKNNNEEKEIKVRLSEDECKLLISELQLIQPIKHSKQKDIYYDRQDLYITNLNRGLRIRYDGDEPKYLEFKSLFFNIKKDNPWFIEENTFNLPLLCEDYYKLLTILLRLHLLPLNKDTYLWLIRQKWDCHNYIDGIKSLNKCLLKANLVPMITVKKERTEYEKNRVIYTFDYIEGLGHFLEIESQNEDPVKILKRLPIEDYQIVRNGYNDMIAVNIPSYLPNEEKQRRFRENPGWNILPNEKEVVEEMLSFSL
jgi:adenylate cyclase class IV